MYVLVQKWSDGVKFVLCTEAGRPLERQLNVTGRRALSAAAEWYRGKVREAFKERQMERVIYAMQFERSYARDRGDHYFMKLEPNGFAVDGPDGEPAMNDCGSTPTPGRAKVLACYEAPLCTVPTGEANRVRKERVLEIEDGEGRSEFSGKIVPVARVVEPAATSAEIPAEWIDHAMKAARIARSVTDLKFWAECDIVVLRDKKGEYHMFKVNAWERPESAGILPWSPPPYPQSAILGVVDAEGRVRPYGVTK